MNTERNFSHEVCRDEDEDTSKFPEREYSDGIRDGADRMLDRVRASLKNWPHAGCDKDIAESIDRICKDYHNQQMKQAWMEQFSKKVQC